MARKNGDVPSNDESIKFGAEVLVVGGGPVGLFTAYLCGLRGIKTVLLEKHLVRRGQPKAHAINPRSLEIFRQVGLDTTKLRRIGIDPHDVDLVRFVTSFYGWEFGNLKYERQFPDVMNLTPEPLFNVTQPKVEVFLKEAIDKLPSVTVRSPMAWIDAESDDQDRVISTVHDRTTGKTIRVRSNFLVGCDGSRAGSREKLEIPFVALKGTNVKTTHYVTTHFTSELPGKRTGILFFLMQPNGLRTFIRYGTEDWVLVFRFDPQKTQPEQFTEDECCRLVRDAIGRDVPFKFISRTVWSTSPCCAGYYRSRKVRNAFLGGDAAHTFSPTGGLGVNTGFADIHNLIWKIDSVRRGNAADSLLDNYEVERRPVATSNASQSTVNEDNISHLGRLINPEGQTSEKAVERWHSEAFQKQVRDEITSNTDHFDSLDLQLGYVYDGKLRDMSKNVSIYTPSVVKGARFPHAWITVQGSKCSSLDLISYDIFSVISPNEDQTEKLRSELSAQILEMIQFVTLGKDFNTADTSWIRMVFGEDKAQALVVRPDQHVAGKARTGNGITEVLSSFVNV